MINYPIVKHIDGKWHTSNHEILGHKCQIKMQKSKGCKIHIWDKDNSKVVKTFRFVFYSEKYLVNKALNWIKSNYENNKS